MTELWDRIRRRLRPGGTPTMPELYPGENQADSVEIAQEAGTTSVGGTEPHDDFLDSGRISLERSGDAPQDAVACETDSESVDEADPGR